MTNDTRKTTLQADVDASGVKPGFEQVKQGARDMARDVAKSGEQAGAGLDKGIAGGAAAAAKGIERETRSIAASIQRATAAAQAGERGTAAYFEAIAKQRGVSTDALRPYLDQLRAAETASKKAAAGVDTIGMSAKHTAFALRQVPAQFTDIVTSLAAGQNPMQVFLQQGGQLKDLFGGAGAAARALGGYVAGLVNPFTLTAAAIGTVVAGYEMGRAESARFERTLILTGNQAGVTARQLMAAAAGAAELSGGTQRRAAEVLDGIAASAGVAAGNLSRFTAAAVSLERAGGPAAEETAKAFASLAREPLSGALKLNEATGFLTRSTYEQIRALQEQGKTVEAARVAQNAYAQALEERAPQIVQQLGYIERAWRFIKDASAGAVDALAGIGRPVDVIGRQIAELEGRIAANNRDIAAGGEIARAAAERGNAVLTQRLRILQQAQGFEALSAAYAGEAARRLAARTEWDKEGLQYLDREARSRREIARVREEGLRAGASEAEIAERIARIQEKADPGVNLQRIKDAEAQRLEIIKRGESEIETLRATGQMREQEAIEARTALALREIDARQAAASAELELARRKTDGAREVAALEGQLAVLAEQRTSAEKRGRDELTVAIYRQKQAIDAVIRAQQEEDAAARADFFVRESKAREAASLSIYEYGRAIAEEGDALQLELSLLGESERARKIRLEQYRIEIDLKRRLNELSKVYFEDGEAGRERERERLRAAAAQASAQAVTRVYLDEWQRTNDQISQSLTDAIMRGGKSGGELLRDYFKTLVLRPIVQAAVQPVASGISSLLGSVLGQQQPGAGSQANYAQLASLAGSAYSWLFGAPANTRATTPALIESAVGTAGYGASSASGAAAGSLASSVAAYAGWAIAAYMVSDPAYRQGFTTANLDNKLQEHLTPAAPLYQLARGMESLGISQRFAEIFTGAAGTNFLFGRGAPRVDAQGVTGKFSAGDFEGSAFADIFRKGGLFRSDKRWTELSALPDDLAAVLDSGSKAVFEQIGHYADVLGLPAERLAQITSQARIQFTGDAEADRKAITDALAQYSKALSMSFSDALQPFRHAGEEVEAALQRLSTLQGFSEGLNALGGVFSRVAGQSVDMREALIEMAGGMDALQQNAQGFVQSYYQRDEIAGLKAQGLQDVLRGLGITQDVSTKDQFRALVDSTDVSTKPGQERLVSLLQASTEFASVADYLAETGKTLAEAASQAPLVPALEKLFQGEGMKQQIDAINGVTNAVQRVEEAVDRVQEAVGLLTDRVVINPYTTWYQEVGG